MILLNKIFYFRYLDEFNEALYLVDKEENLKEVTVVVSGMTGLTQQPAKFTLSVSEGLDN